MSKGEIFLMSSSTATSAITSSNELLMEKEGSFSGRGVKRFTDKANGGEASWITIAGIIAVALLISGALILAFTPGLNGRTWAGACFGTGFVLIGSAGILIGSGYVLYKVTKS